MALEQNPQTRFDYYRYNIFCYLFLLLFNSAIMQINLVVFYYKTNNNYILHAYIRNKESVVHCTNCIHYNRS